MGCFDGDVLTRLVCVTPSLGITLSSHPAFHATFLAAPSFPFGGLVAFAPWGKGAEGGMGLGKAI